MSEQEAKRTVQAIAKGVNAYAFRIADIAERLNNLSKEEDIESRGADFAALLTSLIVMSEVLTMQWKHGVSCFLDDNHNDAGALERYQVLTAAVVNSDLNAVWSEFVEHISRIKDDETNDPS